MDLQTEFDAALRAYWTVRSTQAETGTGEGSGADVRGGRHFDELQRLVAKVFLAEGFSADQIFTGRGATIPGFYRPTKDWDLIVVDGRDLVAAFELKSLGGPSFSNNSNNRAEEAIGNATDIWCTYRAKNLGNLEPWLGYFYLVEDAPKSRRKLLPKKVLAGQVEDSLQHLSYQGRAEQMCLRLQRNKIYNATCLAISSRDPAEAPIDPNPEISWPSFVNSIQERIKYVGRAGAGGSLL